MIIERIKLKNYRQYRDEVIIEFGSSEKKNVNIIIGSNGAGKTNLSNAIQWCFYGEEPSLDKEGIEFGILNMETFQKLEEGKSKEVSVEVTFKLENGEVYSVERTKNIEKRDNRQGVLPYDGGDKDGSRLKANFYGRGVHQYDENFPSRLIDILAPKKISEFFFFNGERLETYFRESISTKEKIKDSIFKISQLDLLSNIKDRLDLITREYRQETKKLSPKLEDLCKKIETLENEKAEKIQKIKDEEKQSGQLKEQRTELLSKYKDYSGSDIKKIIEKNEELEKKKEETEEELVRKRTEKREILFKNACLFISIDAIKKSIILFSDARKNGVMPPKIKPDFIKELLDGGACICSTDISTKNPKHRKKVEDLLNKFSKIGFHEDELTETERDIDNIKNIRLESVIRELKLFNESIKNYEDQINYLSKQIEENNSKIGNKKIKKSQIVNFQEKIAELNEVIERTRGEIDTLKAKKDEIEYNLKTAKEELAKENQKLEKGKDLNKLIDFCEKCKDYAEEIQSKIMNEIRQEISKETEEHYKELHWKKNENIDIIIDENYYIRALQKGYNKFGAFAAGETALLAMSFLVALNHVSGFKVPIVMDTALGRISTGPRENFANNIATYLKDNQIILLFTQAEFSPEVRKSLEPYINHQYTIEPTSSSALAIRLKKDK